jgi:hypothetical protein
MGELIDELVVQNYAHSVKGFARDLDQPALRKAREWRIPTQIGILAWFWPTDDGNPRSARESSIGSRTWSWRCFFLLGGLMGHACPTGGSSTSLRFLRRVR